MKTILCVLALVLLAGCGTATPTETVTVTAEPEQSEAWSSEEAAFMADTLELTDLVIESAAFFAEGDILNEQGVEYVTAGVEQWNEGWSKSTCPSERLEGLYDQVTTLSSQWFDICECVARMATGEDRGDELTDLLNESMETMDAINAELEAL